MYKFTDVQNVQLPLKTDFSEIIALHFHTENIDCALDLAKLLLIIQYKDNTH